MVHIHLIIFRLHPISLTLFQVKTCLQTPLYNQLYFILLTSTVMASQFPFPPLLGQYSSFPSHLGQKLSSPLALEVIDPELRTWPRPEEWEWRAILRIEASLFLWGGFWNCSSLFLSVMDRDFCSLCNCWQPVPICMSDLTLQKVDWRGKKKVGVWPNIVESLNQVCLMSHRICFIVSISVNWVFGYLSPSTS